MAKVTDDKGAWLCARMTFKASNMTVSVKGKAYGSLVETVTMFREYFEDSYPGKIPDKLELFLSESDMHAEELPWHTTFF